MTIRIEEGGVKVQCAINAHKKTGNRDEESAARNDRVEEKAKVAAKDKWHKKDYRKELETYCESEKRGGECAAIVFEKNEHSQNRHCCEDTYLSPLKIVKDGKRRQRETNEKKLDRQFGWDEPAEGEHVENDEEDLQNAPEDERSIESQRGEYGEQDGDKRRIDKAFDRQLSLEDRLSHGIVKICEVTERLRACVHGGSEVISVSPGDGIVGKKEDGDQDGANHE